jgi:hypothetical protein
MNRVMPHVEVFWVVTPCSVVVGYQIFRGTCCLHLHCDPHNAGIPPQHYSQHYSEILVFYHNVTQRHITENQFATSP